MIYTDQRLIIVDLEATCDKGERWGDSETIEIGAVMYEAGKTGERLQSFVRPISNPELTPFCKELTGIGQVDVDGAHTFALQGRLLRDWASLYGAKGFCSWGAFDMEQLKKDCELHDIWYGMPEHYDVAREFTRLTGRRMAHRKAMRYWGVEATGAHHRGLDDALNVCRVIDHMRAMREVG